MAGVKGVKSLISKKDLPAIKRVSNTAKPHSQRAQALLAVNDGSSHAEAAKISGLRPTQVTYWERRYRNNGLACFPEELLAKEENTTDISKALEKETKKKTVSKPPSSKSVAKKAKKADKKKVEKKKKAEKKKKKKAKKKKKK